MRFTLMPDASALRHLPNSALAHALKHVLGGAGTINRH
jgi:hypothetical protein